MTIKEFKAALELLECWGIEVEDADKTFAEIDDNGGGEVLFLEFATWVMKQGLFDDEFDDDDD